MTRPLVLAAHGTASEPGRRVVEACAASAAAALGVPHVVGYVDVCAPTLEEALARVGREATTPPVVVPFFLASGYHVRHDVPAAVAPVPGALVTPALGVAEEVVAALVDGVRGAATAAGEGDPATLDAVLVVGAGSSVESARAEVARVAALVGERLGVASGTAYLSGPGPRPEEEAARLRGLGHERLVLAAHLLAPGFFHDRAADAAAALGTAVTPPLGLHPALTELVVRRYREALAGD